MSWAYLIAAVVMALALSACAPEIPATVPPPPTSVPPPPVSATLPAETAPTSETTERLSPSDRVPRITIDELLQKVNSNADILIIDTRTDVVEQFFVGHIKGAIPLPLDKIIEGQWLPPGSKDREIVFYCT